MRETEIEV